VNDLSGLGPDLATATWETVYMVGVSSAIAVLLGLPLGILLYVTDRGGLLPAATLNRVLGVAVNIVRSIPFIILLVAVTPLTRALVGTTIGSTAAIVPLAISAIPFFARLVESSLREVHPGKVEASVAMGSRRRDVIRKVLVPEAGPGLVVGATVTVVALIGYSAMAGAVGGGGLGDFAIRYGYQRFQTNVMIVTVVLLVVIVQGIQYGGDRWARGLAHR
jgi:D-methionine transport system permease protein